MDAATGEYLYFIDSDDMLEAEALEKLAEKGAYGVACAYATILIAIVYAAIVLMNLCIKYFGTSKQVRVKEGE